VPGIARRLLVTAAVIGCAVCASAPAHATFPGENGKIVFSKDGDLWTINPDGSELTQLTSGPRNDSQPKWAPDGSMIAFDGDKCSQCVYWHHGYDGFGVFIRRPDGSVTRYGESRVDYTDAAWSPDLRFVFTTEKNAFNYGWPPGQGAKLVVARLGGAAHVIGDAFLPPVEPDWSPLGDRLIVLTHYDGSVIYFSDEAGHMTPFHDPSTIDIPFSFSPSWSPDGAWISWVAGGSYTDCTARCIYTAKPDGSDLHRLTQDVVDSSVTWSPDGSQFAFTRQADAGATAEVWLMKTDGSDAHFLTEGSQPDWQPRVAPHNIAAPRVLGLAREGQTLTAGNGRWFATPDLAYTYQWILCDPAGEACADIDAATGQAYTLPSEAALHTIRVRVTATNDLGEDSAESGPSALVGEILVGSPASETLVGTAGADMAKGLGGNDTLTLGAGNDIGRGGPGNDLITGGAGADLLLGGPGHDLLRGRAGRDRIFASDGVRDLIKCGPGRDFVVADRRDFVAANCEIVHYW
jgi:Tol biopolymer transport system component